MLVGCMTALDAKIMRELATSLEGAICVALQSQISHCHLMLGR